MGKIPLVIGAISLVPTALTIILRRSLPIPVVFTLGHIAAAGWGVTLATLPPFKKRSVGILGKSRSSGRIRWPAFLLFWPYHVGMRVRLYLRRKKSSEPLYHEIEGNWALGGWPPSSKDLPPGKAVVVDCTCELPRKHSNPYICLPTWDTCVPEAHLIQQAVLWAEQQRQQGSHVFVHCAHGHGRSAAVLAAMMIHAGQVGSIDEAVAIMQKSRPKVKLNSEQRGGVEAWLELRKQGN